MARVHGKDLSTLTLAAQALLTDTIDIGPQVSVAVHDTTTLGDDWMEETAGLKGGDTFTHQMMYDNTNTTGTWAYLTSKFGTSVELIISDGTRTITGNVLVTNVSLPIAVSDMMKFTATYQWTGAVAFT